MSFDSIYPSVIAGVISGTVTAILLVGAAAFYKGVLKSQKYVLEIPTDKFLSNPEFQRKVLHARNDDGQIVNRVYEFKRTRHGTWQATFRHTRGLGFQYKCFISFRAPYTAIDIIAQLEAEGFVMVDVGTGQLNRVFFILPYRPTALDPAGHDDHHSTNNHFWPE